MKVFDYFDVALLINLDSDVVALTAASKTLSKAGIQFTRFPARPPPVTNLVERGVKEAGYFGCAESHRAALKYIIENKFKRALILEDDVVLRRDIQNRMIAVAKDLQAIHWDIFYLGLNLIESESRITANLRRVKSGCHTHAYAVTDTAAPRLIAVIDKFLKSGKGWFDAFDDPSLIKVVSVPTLAVQSTGVSSSEGKVRYRFKEELKGLDLIRFFCKCGETHRLYTLDGPIGKILPRRLYGYWLFIAWVWYQVIIFISHSISDILKIFGSVKIVRDNGGS